jgi:hypothetical protein
LQSGAKVAITKTEKTEKNHLINECLFIYDKVPALYSLLQAYTNLLLIKAQRLQKYFQQLAQYH